MLAAGPIPPDWTVNVGKFAQTMTVTALVTIGGTRKDSGTLAAMVGKEVRGVQSTAKIPPFGAYVGKAVYMLVVRGDTNGELVSFHYYDGTSKIPLDKTIKFEVNGKLGNAVAPYMLTQRQGGSSWSSFFG